MKEVELRVKGIMCGGCVQKITDEVGGTAGIQNIKVSTDMKNVTVSFDDEKLSKKQIADLIENVEGKNFKVIG